MKRRLTAVLTALCMLAVPAVPVVPESAVIAEDSAGTVDVGQCGDDLIYKLTGDGVLHITGSGSMEDYYSMNSVPWKNDRDQITGLEIENRVTSIGKWAFCFTNLKSVVIPGSVNSIGQRAFSECANLKSITIPASVTSIGDDAFRGCTNLTIYGAEGSYAEQYANMNGITFVDPSAPPIVESGTCGENLRWKLDDAGTLTISGTGKMKDYDGFTYDHGGDMYIEPDRLSPFSNKGKIQKVIIKPGVTSIGNHAFNDCRDLTSVTIPDSVTSIGHFAFYYCKKLTSIAIPDGVTSIGEWAFCDCTSLTSVTIPDSVTSIEVSAFEGCTGLTSVIIPDSVTSIGTWAFYNCTRLTSVTIPDSVTSIGVVAFQNCTSLTIYGKSGSCAETYAKKSGIPFISTDIPAATEPAATTSTTRQTTTTNRRTTTTTRQTTTTSTTRRTTTTSTTHRTTTTSTTHRTTTTTAATTTTTTTTTTQPAPQVEPYSTGDVTGDSVINAKDASAVLIAAAKLGTGKSSGLTAEAGKAADVNGDGTINAKDAGIILRYAAAVGTGDPGSISKYV